MFDWRKKILRVLFFVGLIILPVIFGWWLFVLLSLLLVLIGHKSYEPIIVGGILDNFYYFGAGFWQAHFLLSLGALFALVSLFLENKVNSPKLL